MGSRWTGFYEEHRLAMVSYAFALTGSEQDAADLIQDVMLKMIRDNANPNFPKTFLFKSLRNARVDGLRGRRRPTDATSLELDLEATVDTRLTHNRSENARIDLAGSLNCISSAAREVITLKVFCEFTFRDIAEVLDRPLGTVTSQYQRGLEELALLLEGEIKHAS